MKLTLSRWILLLYACLSCLLGIGRMQIISFGMRKLAASTNQFGLDLMKAMDKSDVAIAFCPFCISSSLAMLLMGSHSTMESALRQSLYLWGMQPQEINLAYYDMINHLGVNLPSGFHHRKPGIFSSLHDNDTENEIIFLNNIYVQRDFAINYHYHILLQRFYKTPIHPLDFVHNGEETRQHINAIVEMQSEGKVKDILPDRQSAATQLILLSALYFQGTLDLNLAASKINQNSVANNHKSQFIGPFGENYVMLESRYSRIRYGVDPYLNCTTVEMPFKGGVISLVAIMPHDPNGLDLLLTRLSGQTLNDVINNLEVKRVTLKMPKISFEKNNRNLSLAFANMGLSDLFKPGYASLYGISNYKWLHVSDVIHKTIIDIKESSYNVTSRQFYKPVNNELVNVEFDKPFIYFVLDNISGLILVMGKIGREPVNYRLPVRK